MTRIFSISIKDVESTIRLLNDFDCSIKVLGIFLKILFFEKSLFYNFINQTDSFVLMLSECPLILN